MRKICLLFILIFTFAFVSCEIIIDDPVVETEYFTVHYEIDDSCVSENDVQTEVYDVYVLVTPTIEGNYFEGWYLNASCTDGPYIDIIGEEAKVYTFYPKLYTPDEEAQAEIDNVIDKINAIPDEVTLDNQDAINDAYTDYYFLNEKDQKLVTNIDKLLAARQTINELSEKLAKAQEIVSKITPLITSLANYEVEYEALEVLDKITEYVTDLDEYTLSLITNLDDYKSCLAKATEQKEAIDKVNEAIAAIPDEIDSDSYDAITKARNLYNNLKQKYQVYITDYERLTNAEEEFKKLPTSPKDVIAYIDLIPDPVTLESKAAIDTAREAYDNLQETDKSKVTNYKTLTDAEETYLELENERNTALANVTKTIQAIQAIRYVVTVLDEEQITSVRKQYESLGTDYKDDVYNYKLLEFAEARLATAKTQQVTYILGDSIYSSVEETTEAFFGDFFNFIYSQEGGARAIQQASRGVASSVASKYDLTTPEGFIGACHDWYFDNSPSKGSGCRAIANALSKYFNEVDRCGFIEDQPTTTFIGYCYQNGWHVDLIKFLIRFFAYWRLDEGYAAMGNTHADAFDETWSITVDVCKYFTFAYGWKQTAGEICDLRNGEGPADSYGFLECYARSKRLTDCFNSCASSLYGTTLQTTYSGTLTLPTADDIKLRGYTFVGWYDNKDFTGSPVTKLTSSSKNTVLYAKWDVDQEQQDTDDAAFVDVYIWNMTSKYQSSKQTKLVALYNSLNENAKAKIQYLDYYNSLLTR